MANKNTQNNAACPAPTTTPAPGFNEKKYAPYIAEYNFSEEQQRAILQAIWKIMSAFADYGMGIDPSQLICGWIEENRGKAPLTGTNQLLSTDQHMNQSFERAATGSLKAIAGKKK